MTDLPEIIRHATGLSATLAADLAVAGGILRCGVCSAEQPVGDIAANLTSGWPRCQGLTMTWVTNKLLAAESRDVTDGYELVAVVSEEWRVETGKLCARKVGRTTCRRPSAAEINRTHTRIGGWQGTRTFDAWWPYCLTHLYANWIEKGQVWHWILKENADA